MKFQIIVYETIIVKKLYTIDSTDYERAKECAKIGGYDEQEILKPAEVVYRNVVEHEIQ